jgi:hypothetical protein
MVVITKRSSDLVKDKWLFLLDEIMEHDGLVKREGDLTSKRKQK